MRETESTCAKGCFCNLCAEIAAPGASPDVQEQHRRTRQGLARLRHTRSTVKNQGNFPKHAGRCYSCPEYWDTPFVNRLLSKPWRPISMASPRVQPHMTHAQPVPCLCGRDWQHGQLLSATFIVTSPWIERSQVLSSESVVIYTSSRRCVHLYQSAYCTANGKNV